MVIFIKDNGDIIKLEDSGFTNIKMVQYIKGNGKMIYKMVMDNKYFLMVPNMLVDL